MINIRRKITTKINTAISAKTNRSTSLYSQTQAMIEYYSESGLVAFLYFPFFHNP